jgi:hypothetical protein
VLALAGLAPAAARQQFIIPVPVTLGGLLLQQRVRLVNRPNLPQPRGAITDSGNTLPAANSAEMPNVPQQAAQQPSSAAQAGGSQSPAGHATSGTSLPAPTISHTMGLTEPTAAAAAASPANVTAVNSPSATAQPTAANGTTILPRTAAGIRPGTYRPLSTTASSAAKAGVRPSVEDGLVPEPSGLPVISEQGSKQQVSMQPIPPPTPAIIPVNGSGGLITPASVSNSSDSSSITAFLTPGATTGYQSGTPNSKDDTHHDWADIPAGPLSAAPPVRGPATAQVCASH